MLFNNLSTLFITYKPPLLEDDNDDINVWQILRFFYETKPKQNNQLVTDTVLPFLRYHEI
jgi:hypothetical protein